MAFKPAMHGRDHRPHKYGTTTGASGADPADGMLYLPSAAETDGQVLTRDSTATYGIKWAAGGGVIRNSPKFTVQGYEWQQVFQYNQWTASFTADSAAPFGGYADLGNTDGNRTGFGLPLGPYASFWMVRIWYYRDTDYGKLDLEMATTKVDELTATSGGSGTAYSIEDIFNGPASWYHPSGGYTIDCYSATPGWTTNFFQPFWVWGSDGQMLSAHGTSTPAGVRKPFGTVSDMAAGGDESVWWWIRVKVNGKNASSSGYKARVAGITCARMTGSGYSVT